MADIADIATVLFAGVTIYPKDFNKDLREFIDIVKNLSTTLATAALAVLVVFLLVQAAGLLASSGIVVSISKFIGALNKIIGFVQDNVESNEEIIEIVKEDKK